MTIEFTPKQTEAFKAITSGDHNFVLYGGAIRGGKTFWGLCTLLVFCEAFPGSRWCVIRKDMEKIRTTTIPSFEKLHSNGLLKRSPYEYTHHNGAIILFKSENFTKDRDLNWMRGLEVNGFLFEEINECEEKTLNKAIERAGSWILADKTKSLKPKIMATCNPSQGWVKDRFYTPWKNKELNPKFAYIPAKITDNKHLPEHYREGLKSMHRYEYEVFVNGNWDVQLKTGGEFFKAFELEQHVRPVQFDPDQPVHISVDNNVYPYISVSVWQTIKTQIGWDIIQVDEVCAKDPNNTATKAGELLCRSLKSKDFKGKVFIYGDPTTRARNTIDDNKKSFLDKFLDIVKKSFTIDNRMPRKAPVVSTSGDFLNEIFEREFNGIKIIIGEHCKESINDYIETKQDKDGGVLKKRVTDSKTGVSYEPNGHLVDCIRYFITRCFSDEYSKYVNRFTNPQDFYIPPPNSVVNRDDYL